MTPSRTTIQPPAPAHPTPRPSAQLASFKFLIVVFHLSFLVFNSSFAANEQAAPSDLQQLQLLKQQVVAKNIFQPARTPPPQETPAAFEPVLSPQPLKRPFRLLGIRRVDEQAWADLFFADQSSTESVTIGDTIEQTVTVLDVGPTSIRVNYTGREVRIAVGESSDDALERLRGFDSSYILLGTHTVGDRHVADILILRDGTVRMVEEDDLLGQATVTRIEDGRVHLFDSDGTPFFIE